jgi:hypothetical protein
MKAVTVVFAINIPYLCGSYVVKGPADRRCASRMLNQLCRRTKSGIPTSRYRMPIERVLGSVHGSCRKRTCASSNHLFVSASSASVAFTRSRALSLHIHPNRIAKRRSHQSWQKKYDGQYEGRTRDLGVISTTL